MNNNINAPHIADLNRRNVIKQIATFCGLALSASSLELIAADSKINKNNSKNSQGLLNTNQIALIRQLGEIIIPAT